MKVLEELESHHAENMPDINPYLPIKEPITSVLCRSHPSDKGSW